MIAIRRAGLRDQEFIRQLTVDQIAQGVPESRDIPNETVIEMARQGLAELDQWIVRKRDFAILIADDSETDKSVGFLILEFNHIEEATGEKQTYIFNMAVQADYWGKYVGHQMVAEAARISNQRGYRYMTSKVSASNERALLSAIKLGFEIERYQLTMACGPEGPVRMPGRPMAARGHAVSRLLTTRKRKLQTNPDQISGETP